MFVVSKILQFVTIDLQQAFELFKNAYADILKFRDEFNTFVDNSKTVCKLGTYPLNVLTNTNNLQQSSMKSLIVIED